MKTVQLYFIALAIALSSIAQAGGLSDLGGNDNEFLAVEDAYQANITVKEDHILIDWVIAPGYYLYKDKFKFLASTPSQDIELLGLYNPGTIKYDIYYEKDVESYYVTTQVKLPLSGLPESFELKARSQGCADAGLCYPPHSQYFQIDQNAKTAVETPKSVAQTSASNPQTTQTLNSSAASNQSLWVYLLMALGGGLLLNLMPCVFPVLSLKALTFASSSDSAHGHQLHGWAYTAGVVGSFVIVALIISAAKAAGEQSGWGFQLQAPEFVAAMAYLFLVMGLSLSGMVHFGASFMGVGQGLTAQEGLRGSFFTGILAAVVASPCTGPLMAPALGFALSQPIYISLAVFIALGFGMALPFLLLSYSPKLSSLLPRPGPWMEKLKELLAFPMYLTATWLLFVFGRQVGMVGVFFLLLGAIAIVFAIWLFKHQPSKPSLRWMIKALGLSSLAFAGHVALTSEDFRNPKGDNWQVFSEEKVASLRAQGQPVFVDFTADWCITCKANKAVALSREGFLSAVSKHNVALLRADWTNENKAISKVLGEFNRSGVPLYLMYPADLNKTPEVLPQVLSQEMVIQAIEKAAH